MNTIKIALLVLKFLWFICGKIKTADLEKARSEGVDLGRLEGVMALDEVLNEKHNLADRERDIAQRVSDDPDDRARRAEGAAQIQDSNGPDLRL